MKKKYYKTRVIVVLAVMLALQCFVNLYYNTDNVFVKASSYDVVTRSVSKWESENGNKIVIMKEGSITITSRSKAASEGSNPRWHTIGFGISLTKQNSTVTVKNRQGEDWVGPAAPANVAILELTDNYMVESINKDGWLTTTWKFPAKLINEKLAGYLTTITNDTVIYLNAVTQTYWLHDSGYKEILEGKNGGITSWYNIMTAAEWGYATLAGFAEYFNMELGFAPGPQPNTLYYKYGDEIVWIRELADKNINDSVSWDESETPKYNGKNYKAVGYYTRSKLTKEIIDTRTSPPVDVADIVTNNAKVPLGGLVICIEYEELKGPLPNEPAEPTPTLPPVPKPTVPPIDIPAGGSASKPLDTMLTDGAVRADIRGNERFNVLQGIATTESLYTQVRGTEYNIGYNFIKKVVIVNYPISVTKTFHLSWTDAKDKTKIMKDDVDIVQTISVKRACAYWMIANFDYYTIDKATVYNAALPGGVSTMYPDGDYYSPPSLSLHQSNDSSYHIIPPSQAQNGIILATESLSSSNGAKPTVPAQDFTFEANSMCEEIKVRNDYLSFNGAVIMDNNLYVKETPNLVNLGVLDAKADMSGINTLYKPNQIIKATLLNGVYQSTGTLTYRNHASAVSSSGSKFDTPIFGLNSVTIHTPVICDASITTENPATGISSNDRYVQALKTDSNCLQLVLDPDDNLSDFTVDINNYGRHLGMAGYFTRDFAWCLRDPSVSYLAEKNNIYRNEVRFPFDVFYRNPSGVDEFIPKNTWMRFGHSTPTFYLPMWVNEGIYTVDFRTIAVNGVNTDDQLSKTQTYANTDRSNYVATDTVKVQVSGRLYGLTIYDVTDYPTWETVFRKAEGSSILKLNEGFTSGVTKDKFNEAYSYDYTVGTADQYGIITERLKKYTLPIVNGSHPKYSNIGIMKTGYAVKFKVNTTGNAYSSGDSVAIKPTFYYVDKDGKNRREVDIYYTENFNGKSNRFVKMGSSLDYTNVKTYRCGNLNLGIPLEQLELMSSIQSAVLGKYLWKTTDLFTYTNIKIKWPLMTYVNTDYLLDLKAGTQYEKIKLAGIKDADIVKRMQTYYAEYYLPADIKAVEKGFDVNGYAKKYGVNKNDAYWLTGGYIIINFDIVTKDTDGNKNLSYLNSVNAEEGFCSMWSFEKPEVIKSSYNGKKEKSTVFNFLPGDFMVYYTDKNLHEDYETYIIR